MASVGFSHHELGISLAAPTSWTLTYAQPGQTSVTATLDGKGECTATLTAGTWTRSLSNGTDTFALTPIVVTSGAVEGGDTGAVLKQPVFLPANPVYKDYVARIGSIASVASNGASSAPPDCQFVAPADLTVLNVWKVPQANEATVGTATTSASYRQHTLIDFGTAGAGTTAMGTLNVTASAAANQPQAFTLAATPTVAAGHVIGINQTTVGGTSSANGDATTVQASNYLISYQLL